VSAPARLARASRAMAIGTLASRGTGLLRTVALAAALGTTRVSDAYNLGNTLPNVLYDLLLGGILSSVVVPVLVQARQEDPDGGRRLSSALLSLVVVGLLAATVLGVLAAPLLVRLYVTGAVPARERALEITFTRFFLPQCVFYGLTGVVTAILNTRGKFGAPTAVPVLNNLVLLATIGVFFALPGPGPAADRLTTAQTLTLGLGTTAGVIIMALALVPGLRGSGIALSLASIRGQQRLVHATRLAGWVVVYVITNQVGYLFVVNFASSHHSSGVFTAYSYAYQLFQLPYAVVTVSIMSALLPRMSGHAAAGRRIHLVADVSRGLRITSVLILPAALLLLALGPPLGETLLAYGHATVADGRLIGDGLAAFAVGLPFFCAFQLLARAFYAAQDSRTPAMVNLVATVVNVVVDGLVVAFVPHRDLLVGLALGFGAGYAAGAVLCARVLRRRLGGLDGWRVGRLIARAAVAALAAGAVARVVSDLIQHAEGTGHLAALAAVVAGGLLGSGVYLGGAARMHILEVGDVLSLLPGRAQSGGRRRRSL
jgi:putative peptidoglycan lipid II flippase